MGNTVTSSNGYQEIKMLNFNLEKSIAANINCFKIAQYSANKLMDEFNMSLAKFGKMDSTIDRKKYCMEGAYLVAVSRALLQCEKVTSNAAMVRMLKSVDKDVSAKVFTVVVNS